MGEDWQAKRHRARTPETMALYDAQHRRSSTRSTTRDDAARGGRDAASI